MRRPQQQSEFEHLDVGSTSHLQKLSKTYIPDTTDDRHFGENIDSTVSIGEQQQWQRGGCNMSGILLFGVYCTHMMYCIIIHQLRKQVCMVCYRGSRAGIRCTAACVAERSRHLGRARRLLVRCRHVDVRQRRTGAVLFATVSKLVCRL